MPSQKRKFGDIGEREAEDFLVKNGYRIIDRNYRVKNLGEIDLVGEKDGKLIFFEVKTRSSEYASNFPIELSINEKKRKNLKRICQIYLNEKLRSIHTKWRVDAIFVRFNDVGKYEIEQLENILWESYY